MNAPIISCLRKAVCRVSGCQSHLVISSYIYFLECCYLIPSWLTLWTELFCPRVNHSATANLKQNKNTSDKWVSCSSLLIYAPHLAKWSCSKEPDDFSISGAIKSNTHNGIIVSLSQLTLLLTNFLWTNQQVQCGRGMQFLCLVWCASEELQIWSVWYCSDSKGEHENWCQSDSVKANAFAYPSISHLFWRVGDILCSDK